MEEYERYKPGEGFFLHNSDFYQIWSSDKNRIEFRLRHLGEYITVEEIPGDSGIEEYEKFIRNVKKLETFFLRSENQREVSMGSDPKETWQKIKNLDV